MSTTSDLDILTIDSAIQKNFETEYQQLPKHKERLEEMERTMLSDNLLPRIKHELQKVINDTRNLIKKIESKEDLNFYIAESAELLEAYNQILKTPIKLSFTSKIRPNDKEKNTLIQKYVEIAQKYYKINLKPIEKKNRISCNNCPNKKDFIIEENAYICPDCGSQQEVVQHTTSYKDSDRVNIATKYTYDRKVHFRDSINQYQGKQNCTIDQKVYDDLEDAYEKHHLLQGNKTVKKEIRFAKITKEHVIMFLRELGYSKHYENVNLIYYNQTGKKPDDISYLEDKLLADFDLLVETYDKHFKNKVDRVNFISTQYVLFQLLQRHRHPCRKEDFVILKTMDRKSFHDTLAKELFTILGWNFHALY